MMKVRYYSFVLSFFCLFSFAFSQSHNVLEAYNGDFEAGMTHWRFFEVPNDLGSTAEFVTDDVAEGIQAVKLTFVANDGTLQDHGFDNFDTHVPVFGGVEYTASIMAKKVTGDSLRLSMLLGFFDSDSAVVGQQAVDNYLTDSYTQYQIKVTSPDNAAYCWLAFRLYDKNGWAAGTILLDDARILTDFDLSEVIKPRVMPTTLSSEDVPIASINISEAPYNAANDGLTDVTEAFQKAINDAAAVGGAVIFVPAGHYRFDGTLLLKEKVILRGEWANPELGGGVQGTVLDVYAGQGNENGTPFLSLYRGSGIKNMNIWYPQQTASAVPYPWTILCNPAGGTGDNTSVINVTLVNPYRAIKIGPQWNELHYIKNVYGVPLKMGVWMDYTTDIGRIFNVHFEPKYWSESGLNDAPSETSITSWLQQNATGFEIGRSDWEYMYDISLKSYKIGVRILRTEHGAPNGVIYGLDVSNGEIGILLDDVSSIGYAISGSNIEASYGSTPYCVYARGGFESVVQFNTCTFGGQPAEIIHSDAQPSSRLTFQNCTFKDWGYGDGGAAVNINRGSIAVLSSSFEKSALHFNLGSGVNSAQILDNTYPGELPQLENNSETGEIIISQEPLFSEKMNVSGYVYPQEPRPATNDLFVATDSLYGAKGDGTTDDTQAIQDALDAAASNGGGTVFLPAGHYKIATHLTIPSGVELRGIWDVPHHTTSHGTVLYAFEGKGDEFATPFISLESGAGLRGLTVWYPEQTTQQMYSYPWTIQTRGADCWIKDVALGNPYKGADLASYNSRNHYVSYLCGSPLKTGIFISNNSGDGWIENMQFNPHYWLRNPGYPQPDAPVFETLMSYQQQNMDAFKFGYCENEYNLGNFVYAALRGMYFVDDGGGCSGDVFLPGLDATSSAIVIESTGDRGLNFINNQLVLLGSVMDAAIKTDAQFSGKAVFYNSLAWGDANGPTAKINGSGHVVIQQLYNKMSTISVNGGNCDLHNMVTTDRANPQYIFGSGIEQGTLFASYAENGIIIQNDAGDKLEADYNYKKNIVSKFIFESGWETDERQNDWNNTLYDIKNVQAADGKITPICKAVNDGHAYAGDYALGISGKSLGGDSVYARFKIFDVNIPILKSSTINYWINPQDSLGMKLKIDLLFTNGKISSNILCITDKKSNSLYEPTTIGEWQEISIPVESCKEGWVVKSVLVSFENTAEAGDFNAYIDNFSIKPRGELPQPWDTLNVKDARPKGEAFYQDSTFIIQGGGTGFFFNSDQFFYMYQQFDKDFQIKARIDDWMMKENTAFLGVTIRDSISHNSKLYITGISRATGLRTMKRLTTGGMMGFQDHNGYPLEAPLWIKLVRIGNVFKSYISYDGISWGREVDSTIIEMDSVVTVGLALTSGSSDQNAMAIFSNVSLSHDIETAIDEANTANIPNKYNLHQNYPNPFNPVTTIKYDIPSQSNLQIDIYNILGMKIRSYNRKSVSPGRYTYVWEAKNSSGVKVPSGVYIVRMNAEPLQSGRERYDKSIKVILLK